MNRFKNVIRCANDRQVMGRYSPALAPRSRQNGFSLIEIALVLIIVGLALGGIVSALGPQLQQRGYVTTQKQLADANEAIIAFAFVNRRLPCPATAASGGLESFCTNPDPGVGCGAPVLPPANSAGRTQGRCSAAANAGFVPAATLGLVGQGGNSLVVDAWAAPLRYTVAATPNPGTANPAIVPSLACGGGANTCFVYTQRDGFRNAYYSNGFLGSTPAGSPPASDVFVCATATGIVALNCGAAAQRANPAFVVYSYGQNTPALGTDENANNNADRVFVHHDKTDSTAPLPNGGFDDLFSWTTVEGFMARLSTGGVLP
jgi:prepilin-type N-terminal cleavage/methylation domain-containing protein